MNTELAEAQRYVDSEIDRIKAKYRDRPLTEGTRNMMYREINDLRFRLDGRGYVFDHVSVEVK